MKKLLLLMLCIGLMSGSILAMKGDGEQEQVDENGGGGDNNEGEQRGQGDTALIRGLQKFVDDDNKEDKENPTEKTSGDPEEEQNADRGNKGKASDETKTEEEDWGPKIGQGQYSWEEIYNELKDGCTRGTYAGFVLGSPLSLVVLYKYVKNLQGEGVKNIKACSPSLKDGISLAGGFGALWCFQKELRQKGWNAFKNLGWGGEKIRITGKDDAGQEKVETRFIKTSSLYKAAFATAFSATAALHGWLAWQLFCQK